MAHETGHGTAADARRWPTSDATDATGINYHVQQEKRATREILHNTAEMAICGKVYDRGTCRGLPEIVQNTSKYGVYEKLRPQKKGFE